jgi:hypothetical protein
MRGHHSPLQSHWHFSSRQYMLLQGKTEGFISSSQKSLQAPRRSSRVQVKSNTLSQLPSTNPFAAFQRQVLHICTAYGNNNKRPICIEKKRKPTNVLTAKVVAGSYCRPPAPRIALRCVATSVQWSTGSSAVHATCSIGTTSCWPLSICHCFIHWASARPLGSCTHIKVAHALFFGHGTG